MECLHDTGGGAIDNVGEGGTNREYWWRGLTGNI